MNMYGRPVSIVMLACSRLGAVWQTVYKTRHLRISLTDHLSHVKRRKTQNTTTISLTVAVTFDRVASQSQSCRLRRCCRTLAGAC